METGEDYFKFFEGTIKENTNYLADVMVYLPEGSEYRFSDSLTIIANGEKPIEIGSISDTYAGFIVKVASTTEKPSEVVSKDEKTNEAAPEQEKQNTSETEEKAKSVEVKVESAENTTVDNSAKTEVAKLINNSVSGKNVTGIDNELKTKISKAVDEGKTIVIEVYQKLQRDIQDNLQ